MGLRLSIIKSVGKQHVTSSTRELKNSESYDNTESEPGMLPRNGNI